MICPSVDLSSSLLTELLTELLSTLQSTLQSTLRELALDATDENSLAHALSPRQSISNFSMLALHLRQYRRGGVHARDKDGAISSPRGLDLRPFPRTYAFPTKFHGDSIANFRGPWMVVKCQNRSDLFWHLRKATNVATTAAWKAAFPVSGRAGARPSRMGSRHLGGNAFHAHLASTDTLPVKCVRYVTYSNK